MWKCVVLVLVVYNTAVLICLWLIRTDKAITNPETRNTGISFQCNNVCLVLRTSDNIKKPQKNMRAWNTHSIKHESREPHWTKDTAWLSLEEACSTGSTLAACCPRQCYAAHRDIWNEMSLNSFCSKAEIELGSDFENLRKVYLWRQALHY